MIKVHLDFETRSEVDLKDCGPYVYAAHNSTDILCLTYKKKGFEPQLIKPPFQSEELQDLANNPKVVFVAHNAQFERCIWAKIMVPRYGYAKIPRKRWRCTLAKAAYFSLPLGLGKAAKALDLPQQKDSEGKRSMMKLAKPRRKSKTNTDVFWTPETAPEDFEALYSYNIDDVLTEEALEDTLPEMPISELKIWQLDQRINDRGIHLDAETVHRILELVEQGEEDALDQLERVTGGVKTKEAANKKTKYSRVKFLEWLQEQGCEVIDTQKASIEALLKTPGLPDNVRTAIECQQTLSRASNAKYIKMLMGANDQNRLQGLLQYHGAHSGRWAGRRIQPQNMTYSPDINPDKLLEDIRRYDYNFLQFLYGDIAGTLAYCVRGVLTATPGRILRMADFSAIEARVVGWLAGEERLLKLFREGTDPYKWMASNIFRIKIEEVTRTQRNKFGKPSVLGCGFQMGPPRFSSQYTVGIELAEKCVYTYRSSFPKIKNFWTKIEVVAKSVVRNYRKGVETKERLGPLTLSCRDNFLFIRLPSGRELAYYDPQLEEDERFGGDKLTYMGLNTVKQWVRQNTYGGKLTENVVQAIARDLMVFSMFNLEAAGYYIVLTVHDEIITDDDPNHGSIEEMCEIMSMTPTWAEGLPVAAEGVEAYRYQK